MRNLVDVDRPVIDDSKIIFYDGILYIIIRDGEDLDDLSVINICLDAEYDDPVTLADIAEKYPKCCKLIYDDCLRGEIYNHNNHRDGEPWELVGKTIGYV